MIWRRSDCEKRPFYYPLLHFILDFARAVWLWEQILLLHYLVFDRLWHVSDCGADIVISLTVFYNWFCKRATVEANFLGSCIDLLTFMQIVNNFALEPYSKPFFKQFCKKICPFFYSGRKGIDIPLTTILSPSPQISLILLSRTSYSCGFPDFCSCCRKPSRIGSATSVWWPAPLISPFESFAKPS